MARDHVWVLGVWHKDGSTEKSFKVKLEPKPKRWAYIPKKKVGSNRSVVMSGELGHNMWWCIFGVDPDWIEMASIPKDLCYEDLNQLKSAYNDKTHRMVKAWPDEAAEHGLDTLKPKQKQAVLFMPDRDPEF